MRKKMLLGLVLAGFLLFSLTQTCFCVPPFSYSPSNVDGWLVEANGGQWSETNGVFRLWCNGTGFYGVTLYKEITPEPNFTFSLQVKADAFQESAGLNGSDLQMGGIYVKPDLPLGAIPYGFNFEYDCYDGGTFVLAGDYSGGGWGGSDIVHGDPNAWYTMQFKLTPAVLTYYDWFTGQPETYNGITVNASVFSEDGHELGSFSTSELSFTINDIHYVGFTVWGHLATSYSFRNIQINGGPITSGGNSSSVSTSHISISAESLSTVAGSPVNVFGALTDSNDSALQNKTVVLSYIFPGIDSWIPISSGLTDEQGKYAIQWINSASGTFTLKAEWSGDESGAGTSNQTSLIFLPYQNQQNFIFESNSTIYDLGYNAAASSLTFNVTGPSGTTGYTRATIAKNLLPDYQNLQAIMDGKPLDYNVQSTADAWVFTFNYSHSTHQIMLNIASNSAQPTIIVNIACLVCVILCSVAACVGLSVFSKKISSA